MEKFGFVGLPNSGKSSLYNALAGGGALAAPYAFATTDPNVGVAKVPDDRLDRLAVMSASKKVVPASVQFVDIGGLVEGASTGEGLGNKFLAHIREVDAIVYLLRAFVDTDVPGPDDPLECLRVVELELALADLETVESQINRRRKAAKQDRGIADEVAALELAYAALGEGVPIYRSSMDDKQRALLREYFLLTDKPALALVNVGEDDVERIPELIAPVEAELGDRAEVIGMCVQLEAEAARSTATSAPSCSRRWASARGACTASSTLRISSSGCARSSPRARRRAAPGPSDPVPRRPRRPVASTPISSGASSGPRSSSGTSCSRSARGRRPGTWASCGSRARITK